MRCPAHKTPYALISLCIGLISFLAFAKPTEPPVTASGRVGIRTRIFKVEKPAEGQKWYHVLSTSDGRVYEVSSEDLAQQLENYRREGSPVQLMIQDKDKDTEQVVGVQPLQPEDAKAYQDPVSDIPPKELKARAESTDAPPTAVTPAAPPQLYSEDPATLSKDIEKLVGAALATPAAPAAPAAEASVPAAIAEARQYGYEPTILKSMDEAWNLFRAQQPLDHDSQCHNRAMVWSYDMWRTHGIKSMKLFMFFTERFRDTYVRYTHTWYQGDHLKAYKWWYHTAPFVYVGDQEIILDSEYLDRPLTVDDWSHYFLSEFIHEWSTIMKDSEIHRIDAHGNILDGDGKPVIDPRSGDRKLPLKALERLTRQQTHCRVISKYKEYVIPELRSNPQADWCLVRKFPMYYLQPQSIEWLDCDPKHENAFGRPDVFLPDGSPKYPCAHKVVRDWVKKEVEQARDRAKPRDRDPKTGR